MTAVSGVIVNAQCRECGKVSDNPLLDMIIKLSIGRDSHAIFAQCRDVTECGERRAKGAARAASGENPRGNGPERSDRGRDHTPYPTLSRAEVNAYALAFAFAFALCRCIWKCKSAGISAEFPAHGPRRLSPPGRRGSSALDQARPWSTPVDRGRRWSSTVDGGRARSTMVEDSRGRSTGVDYPQRWSTTWPRPAEWSTIVDYKARVNRKTIPSVVI